MCNGNKDANRLEYNKINIDEVQKWNFNNV